MEQYNNIQQLLKKEAGQKDRLPVFPPTVIQAVFDGKTGANLEAILAQFNSIYVQYQGTPQATRNIIPAEMRRPGLTITYMNMDSETITERASSAVQKDNDHWGLDTNWSRVDELSLSGEISVSAKGTWIINGVDTDVKAVGPKGDAGLTPWLKTIDNKLHFSYDNVTWEPCSDHIAAYFRFFATSSSGQAGTVGKIQISRDGITWTDLSPEITNQLRIQGYVATSSALPGGKAVGSIYGVGPTYAAEDTAHTNPIYRLYVYDGSKWVDNGSFTSIAAGVVQETGDSEKEVMSQKAVTEKLAELGSQVIKGLTTINEDYHIKQGYTLGSAWVASTNRCSTGFIDCLYSAKSLLINNTNIAIAGYSRWDVNYNYIDYISVSGDVSTLDMPSGYIYMIVIRFKNGNDIQPSDIVPYVYIGKDLTDLNLFSEQKRKLIKLVSIGAGVPSGLHVGDYYSSTGSDIREVLTINGGIPTSTKVVPFENGAVYTCNNRLYVYNGVSLMPTDFVFDDDYGLFIGYFIRTFNADTTKVSTKFINAVKNTVVKLVSDNFEIRGYVKYDSSFTYIEYVSSLEDRRNLTLQQGYYYSVVFSKVDSSANIVPSEIAPYIYINDRVLIHELISETNNLNSWKNSIKYYFDEVFDDEAVNREWFSGTTIGETLSILDVNNCAAIKIPVNIGERYIVKAKGGNGGRGWYLLDSSEKVVALSDAYFEGTVTIDIPSGVSYLIAQSNDGTENLHVERLGIINVNIDKLKEASDFALDSFKCETSFIWNKLSRLKMLERGFCNIGFIGDSWTQGTEDTIDGVSQGDYQGYVKPLTKMLQDEYGFGGLGWLDFARDGGSGKMFGCADMYEHWSYAFTGTVTGVDGSDGAEQAANSLGFCCAHIIFANAAKLSLTFDSGYLDKFKLRYYKNAHFTVSVNGGSAVEVTANSTDGWQETEFGVTGIDTTSVVITSLADNSIIFGMDCFYGNHGVRIHKIGNRSIRASQYLAMNANQWQTGIALLGLDWASVLLAINDIGTSESESVMDTVVTNITNLINRLKVAYTDDGLVTCDINVLGIERIEASNRNGLSKLAKKQKKMAYNNSYGWCSTERCIGKTIDEIVYNGTFSDTIHLNKIGSYAYAKHIYNSLFTF